MPHDPAVQRSSLIGGDRPIDAPAPFPSNPAEVPECCDAGDPSRVLLFATLRWPIAGRLAMAFIELGCEVDVLVPGGHAAALVRGIRRRLPHRAITPLRSLRSAIDVSTPDLIIPCDDAAAVLLDDLYTALETASPRERRVHQLIGRSIGMPPACRLSTHRWQLTTLARDEGLRMPPSGLIQSVTELRDWVSRHGLPAVLKLDQTWGGLGVAIVQRRDDLVPVATALMQRPGIVKSTLRMLLERDFMSWWQPGPRRRSLTAQSFIAGTPANRAVACWEGRVLAGISVEAVTTLHPTGPATVVRPIENSEMSLAASRLVQRLGLSGLWGFDFILEQETGYAYLIEVNPRATPVAHLPLGPGHDLPAALLKKIRQDARVPRPPLDADLIAMFPGEWHREPGSPYLRTAFYDVPSHQEAFVSDCLDLPWAERGLLARARARVRVWRGGTTTARLPDRHLS